ncbi:Srsf2-like protein [Oopsacas minuta]|uniref:Serine/arginine-rich splicing factor 2 n=1 Tax=Oopsacas minuta TaxID=111878 RepID=A0AAV7JJI4_9METZ|nr:Srsf2-like protein [Oopsacas minuta]
MSYYDGKFSYGPPRDLENMVSLKVDNLTFRTTPDDLLPIFERYGRVGDIYIPRDRYSKESRGFAFVRYFDRLDAEDAMDRLDCFKVDGREIRVQVARYARPRESIYSPSRTRFQSHQNSYRKRRRSLSYSPRRHRRLTRSRSPNINKKYTKHSLSRSKSYTSSRSRSRSSSKSSTHSRSSNSSITKIGFPAIRQKKALISIDSKDSDNVINSTTDMNHKPTNKLIYSNHLPSNSCKSVPNISKEGLSD